MAYIPLKTRIILVKLGIPDIFARIMVGDMMDDDSAMYLD